MADPVQPKPSTPLNQPPADGGGALVQGGGNAEWSPGDVRSSLYYYWYCACLPRVPASGIAPRSQIPRGCCCMSSPFTRSHVRSGLFAPAHRNHHHTPTPHIHSTAGAVPGRRRARPGRRVRASEVPRHSDDPCDVPVDQRRGELRGFLRGHPGLRPSPRRGLLRHQRRVVAAGAKQDRRRSAVVGGAADGGVPVDLVGVRDDHRHQHRRRYDGQSGEG